MHRAVFALIVVSCAAPAAAKPAEAAAPEKPTVAAFHAAFGKGDSVLLKKQGQLKETIKYTPGELVQAPFGPVLLSPGEVQDASHINSGKLAIIYLKPTAKGYDVVRKFVPAAEVGSFGKIVDWSVSKSFGDLPIVTVNGAGNWQGYACSTATLIELRPEGPKELVTLPMTYDNAGAKPNSPTQINGRIDNIQPRKGFDVVYFGGSKEFKDRYVRKGDAYVLASGGKSKMQTC